MEALAERQPARDIRSFFPGAATASTTARPPPPPGPAVGAGPSHQPRRQPHAASSGPVRSGGQPLAAAVRAGRLECLGIGPEDAAEIPADDADGADLPPPVPVDEAAAASWVYPTNMPVRPYQHSITKTALLHNTLVCLPTGMGKTLIAAAVMYNFSRWFPAGRCVFLAPTKPLVHQQVGAVRKSVGLPRELCAELTGQMAAEDRRRVWRFARFLFLTAQTFVNDLKTGVCPGEDVVCLVVDEAHKATSNHSYVQAARLLGRRSAGFRVLALSATPGSNAERMQEVVSNLRISRIEARDEQSVDVVGCLKSRQMDKVVVQPTAEYLAGRAAALEAYRALLRKLRESGVGVGDDPAKVRRYSLLTKQKELAAAPPAGMEQHHVYRAQAHLTVAMMVAQGVELASSHGCSSAIAHFRRRSGGCSEPCRSLVGAVSEPPSRRDMEEWRLLREGGGRRKMGLQLREARARRPRSPSPSPSPPPPSPPSPPPPSP